MRVLRYFVVLFCLSVCGVSQALATAPEGAEICFAEKVIDMGSLKHSDGSRSVVVEYTNTGDVPLVVTEVQTSCSCTTIRHSRAKVMPGQKGTLTISLDAQKAPKGKLYRVIKVFSTARSGVARLTLTAEIL